MSEGELARAEERIAHQEALNQELNTQADDSRQQLQVLAVSFLFQQAALEMLR